MQLKKTFKIKYPKLIFALLFIAVFFSTRLPALGSDVINPDAVNWHTRSEQFIVGLKTGQFEKTYQHYHPGVTLMWIVGSTVEIIRQVSPADRVYSTENFLIFHTFAKYSLVFVQLILSFILIHALSRIYNYKLAFAIVGLFSMEAFFIGNSRLIHLDVLLSLFLMLGLSFSYLALRKFSLFDISFAGIFLALAFLTKSIAIGSVLFVLGVGFITLYTNNQRDLILKYCGGILLVFIATTFVLFPALWLDPIYYLTEIFAEGERVGVRKGHEQIFFGNVTRDPGLFFYPITLLMKTSLFTVVGILLYLWKWANPKKSLWLKLRQLFTRNHLPTFLYYISVFYIAYLLVMTFPTKKLDRYMVPLIPYLSLVAVLGYYYSENIFKTLASKIIVVLLFSYTVIIPLFTYYPYYFTYTSSLFGSPTLANRVIAQKPFGVGIPALKGYILSNYGCVSTNKLDCLNTNYPILGFFDTKPMSVIYGNSKVLDIRVYGSNDYDLIVLASDESLPEKVLTSGNKFYHDSSFYINGLEYWRIYAKEN